MDNAEIPVVEQDGILPERDALNNSKQAQMMRAEVSAQWRSEHTADGSIPGMDLEVNTPVVYSGVIGDLVVVPLMAALMYAASDYLVEHPFTLTTVPEDGEPVEYLVFYDGDIIRSDYSEKWARSLVAPAVLAATTLMEFASIPQKQAVTQG